MNDGELWDSAYNYERFENKSKELVNSNDYEFIIHEIKNIHLNTDFLAITNISPENFIAKIIIPKGITVFLLASNVP